MKTITSTMLLWVALTSLTAKDVHYHMVSWYGKPFHGRYTKSGEIFDMYKLTCASNTYKFGTKLKVTNPETGKSVVVRVNDSGGFSKIKLDLSMEAFKRIADLQRGCIKVTIKVLKK